MNTNLFALSDEPFEAPETVISVFKRYDAEIFIDCAEQLADFPSALENASYNDPLSSKARLFAYNYAIKELGFYFPLIPSADCGKLIIDNKLDTEKCKSLKSEAVKLSGAEEYTADFDDIKLGAENGYSCYGILIDGHVVSAAYAFMPDDMIEDEVEIGVETVPAFRGKGYAAQCVIALCKHLVSKDIDVMYSYYEENKASAALSKKCGFLEIARGFEISLERGDNNAV